MLELAAATNGDSFADEYSILTERTLDVVSVRNARLIMECCTDFDEAACTIVGSFLRECGPRIRLGDLGALTGLQWRGFRAAVSLLHEGLLSVPQSELVCPETVAENLLSASLLSETSRYSAAPYSGGIHESE